jgi:hypothetical protein
VRNGDRSKNVNVRGVSQIGLQLSNHATEGSSKLTRAAENLYAGRAPVDPGGVPLGNAKALDVGKVASGRAAPFTAKAARTNNTAPPIPEVPDFHLLKGSGPINFSNKENVRCHLKSS